MAVEKMNCNQEIIDLLEEKASTKQKVHRQSKEIFEQLKSQVAQVAESLNGTICEIDKHVVVEYKDKSAYEAEIHFSGDILLFTLHTNIFTFEQSHHLWKTGYIKKDKRRAYFAMINIYNFLADSFRFNRMNDTGVLLGRIFVNAEGHFFVEGRRQLGFLYNDLPNSVLSGEELKQIIDTAIIYALEYDLTVPDFKESVVISVKEVQNLSNELHLKTSKKLGFRFHTKMQVAD